MIREVRTFPDPILSESSLPVSSFDGRLGQLLDDMYDTMIAKNGVGIAAVQIGVPLRALIISLPDEEGNQHRERLLEVVNPEILYEEGEQKGSEGCLSVPEYYDEVTRKERVVVRFKDRQGAEHELQADGFMAVALQHEIDHLEGRLFIDRISIMKRKRLEKEFKKIFKGKRRL